MNRIPNGTLVRLPDGTTAAAYYDNARRDGTYRTAQHNDATGGTRVDEGWRREQLTPIEPDPDPETIRGFRRAALEHPWSVQK